jgi:hypothetical protein
MVTGASTARGISDLRISLPIAAKDYPFGFAADAFRKQ